MGQRQISSHRQRPWIQLWIHLLSSAEATFPKQRCLRLRSRDRWLVQERPRCFRPSSRPPWQPTGFRRRRSISRRHTWNEHNLGISTPSTIPKNDLHYEDLVLRDLYWKPLRLFLLHLFHGLHESVIPISYRGAPTSYLNQRLVSQTFVPSDATHEARVQGCLYSFPYVCPCHFRIEVVS